MDGDNLTQKHEINFGDLILVDGYGEEPFYVDGWTVETHYTPDEVWTETSYDITSAHTGAYSMAELSDVTRICGKEQAEECLANSVRPESVRIVSTQHAVYTSKVATRNPELVRQRAEEKRRARIDELLDDYIDAKTLEGIIEEDAELYRKKADGILRT